MAALVTRERTAREAGRGLWANAAYQVRPADRPTELQRYQGLFQLVSGRIERVTGSRTHTILELASSEAPRPARSSPATRDNAAEAQSAFRIVWSRSKLQPAVDSALAAPNALIGRSVLVRGWIELRRGPQIEITSADQIEIDPDPAQ